VEEQVTFLWVELLVTWRTLSLCFLYMTHRWQHITLGATLSNSVTVDTVASLW
jgi:hypothetical protein